MTIRLQYRAIYNNISNILLTNCTFVENNSTALYNEAASAPSIIKNSILINLVINGNH